MMASDSGAFVSSAGINALSGNLVTTGQILFSNDLNLSGTIAATGQQAWTAANNNGINLSGAISTLTNNLTLTGQTDRNNALNVSGNLFTTGANLSAVRVTGSALIQSANFSGLGGTQVFLSGGLIIISGVGASLAGVDHGDGLNLSGQLTLTGQTAQNNALNLSGSLAATGQQAWTAANNNAINLSGSLNQYQLITSRPQTYRTGIVSGSDMVYVNFPTGFASVPKVVLGVEVWFPILYQVNVYQPSTTGFFSYWSDVISETGVSLIVTATP